MSKLPEWGSAEKIQRQIVEGKLLIGIGLIFVGVGATDATLGIQQIDTDFSRRFPVPVTQTQANDAQSRIEILNQAIIDDALNRRSANERTLNEMRDLLSIKRKVKEQTDYKARLRNPFVDIDYSKPRSRFLFDFLGMVGGTISAIYGAWSLREGLMKEDWEKNN